MWIVEHYYGIINEVFISPLKFVYNDKSLNDMVVILSFNCKKSKGEFTLYPFFVRFFLRFCFSVKKYALFHPHFHISISAQTRLSNAGQKVFRKKFLLRGTALF